MTRRDWLLLLIGGGLDPIRIQKGLFLFTRETNVPAAERYDFVPYNWGPFSRAIYGDLAQLQTEGLLERLPVEGRGYFLYRQTGAGEEEAGRLRGGADAELVGFVDRLREELVRDDFRQLLRRVYDRYPTFATRSLFRP